MVGQLSSVADSSQLGLCYGHIHKDFHQMRLASFKKDDENE
jgi:hypothetical protein